MRDNNPSALSHVSAKIYHWRSQNLFDIFSIDYSLPGCPFTSNIIFSLPSIRCIDFLFLQVAVNACFSTMESMPAACNLCKI